MSYRTVYALCRSEYNSVLPSSVHTIFQPSSAKQAQEYTRRKWLEDEGMDVDFKLGSIPMKRVPFA